MKTRIYLVLTRHGVVSMTKHLPKLARDEIAVRLFLDIPDGAFDLPILDATIELDESDIVRPRAFVSPIGEDEVDIEDAELV